MSVTKKIVGACDALLLSLVGVLQVGLLAMLMQPGSVDSHIAIGAERPAAVMAASEQLMNEATRRL